MVRSLSFALAIGALACAGCARSGAGSATELAITQQREPMALNPALENGTSSTEWGMLLFSYLVKFGDAGKLVPDVATAVPTLRNGGISADGRTITYHLRRGVRFADGIPLTARDCAWSIEAIDDPRNNVQSRYGYDLVSSAEAPNDATLVLHLKRPFAPLLTLVLAPQGFPILPRHILAKFPNFNHLAFDGLPIGSGPFVVDRWLRGDRVEMHANPYYFRGKPQIARMSVRFVPDPQTAINLLHTHEVGGYFNEQDYANYPLLRSIPGYVVTSTPENAVGAIIFNTQDPLTGDPLVRHALAEAIDVKSLIAKTYRGALTSEAAGRGLFIWAYDKRAYPDIPFDPAQARRLLDRSGWAMGSDGVRRKGGRSLDLLFIIQAATPSDAIIGNTVVQYERAIGARVTLKAFNVTQFVAPENEGGPVYGGKFQMALYPFVNGDDPDSTDQFACANVPPNGYNKSRICDPRIDDLLDAGRSTYDLERRKAIYADLERLLYAELPIALIYQTRQVNAFSDRMRGQTTSLSGAFWNAGAWRLSVPAQSRVPSPAQTPEPCRTVVFPIAGTHANGKLKGGPGLVLSGGGFTSMPHAPVFAFLRSHFENPRGRAGNLVILKASGARDYSNAFYKESRLASVQEILISPCTPRAQVETAAPYVDRADAVLFAGGDQANYVRWKGSTLIDAVKRLYARGGVVGGGSAGLAIQGAIVFDSVAADRVLPADQDVATRDAVADPSERAISFTTGFFAWPDLRDSITDTHFARRDRFGRLVAFMARARHDRLTAGAPIYGVAVDEGSVLIADERGVATLYSQPEADGYRSLGAWILKGGGPAPRLVPGKPLRYTVEVTRLARTGQRYDLQAKRGSGDRYRVTVDGSDPRIYSRNPYTP